MITHTTEPDGTLVIRATPNEDQKLVHRAMAIASDAAAHFGMTLGALIGTCTTGSVSEARGMVLMLLQAEAGPTSMCQLGRIFNGRNASSITNLLKRAGNLYASEAAYRRRYDALRAAVIEDGKEARSA